LSKIISLVDKKNVIGVPLPQTNFRNFSGKRN